MSFAPLQKNSDSPTAVKADQKQQPQFVDTSGRSLQLKAMQQAIAASPKVVAQRELRDSIDASAQVQQRLIQPASIAEAPIQAKPDANNGVILLKKDAALWNSSTKTDGYTKLKLIKTKGGSTGLYRYQYGSGNVIDTFSNNSAGAVKDSFSGESYAGQSISTYPVGSSPIVVSDFNLKTDGGLGDLAISSGNRDTHFKAAKDAGKPNDDKTTWHHKKTYGMMELVDMNVHGAMWHYGGIATWDKPGSDDHEAGDSD